MKDVGILTVLLPLSNSLLRRIPAQPSHPAFRFGTIRPLTVSDVFLTVLPVAVCAWLRTYAAKSLI